MAIETAEDFDRTCGIQGSWVQNANYTDLIPGITLDGLRNWILYGVEPGGFLTAVLRNDLFDAVGRADISNGESIKYICRFIWNEAPRGCWGSKEKMRAWAEAKQEAKRQAIQNGILRPE
jgi:hypothetical protein